MYGKMIYLLTRDFNPEIKQASYQTQLTCSYLLKIVVCVLLLQVGEGRVGTVCAVRHC